MKGVNPMKKVLCLVLVLVLCMSTALAAAVPSITVQDITTPVVEAVGENGQTLTIIIREDAASNAQLLSLRGSSAKDDYFGDIIKEDGTTVKLSELLDTADINEFATIIVQNYAPAMGDVTVRILYRTTQYATTDKVFVLIGLLDGGALTWYAFDAQVIDNQGRIQVVLPAFIMEKLNGASGFIAIASQPAPADTGASAGSSGAPASEEAAAAPAVE